VIGSHEGYAECAIPVRGEVHEPGCLEYHLEAEPANIEVPTLDTFVGYDYRVQVLDVQTPSPSVVTADLVVRVPLSSSPHRKQSDIPSLAAVRSSKMSSGPLRSVVRPS
jgi:hypothetical protein